MTASTDSCLEAATTEIALIQDALAALGDRLGTEPFAGPHALARCLIGLGQVRERVAELAVVVARDEG